MQNLSENLNIPVENEQSDTRKAVVVDALHPNTNDNKIAAVACSNVLSRWDLVLDSYSQESNAITMRGMKGALTAGASEPADLRTVVSAFKKDLVNLGQRSSRRQAWTIETLTWESRSYTLAIFNWLRVPIGVNSASTNANNVLSSNTNGGQEGVKRTAINSANLWKEAK